MYLYREKLNVGFRGSVVLLLGLAFIIDIITVKEQSFSREIVYHTAAQEILHPCIEAEDSLL
jgi:hypothetical protein